MRLRAAVGAALFPLALSAAPLGPCAIVTPTCQKSIGTWSGSTSCRSLSGRHQFARIAWTYSGVTYTANGPTVGEAAISTAKMPTFYINRGAHVKTVVWVIVS